MEARRIDSGEFEIWDEFVDKSPQGSIYAKSWYLPTLGYPFEIWIAEDKGGIQGGTVLIKNKIKAWANPLLCKYLGVFFNDFKGKEYAIVTNQRKVMDALMPQMADKSSYNYTFHPSFVDWLPFYWNGFAQQSLFTYRIPLVDRSWDQVAAEYHAKIRSELKYASKQAYTISENIDFETFHAVNEMSFQRQGSSSPYSKEVLSKIFHEIGERGNFRAAGVKDEEGNITAVYGLLYDRQSASFILNGFDSDKMKRGMNELLVNDAIAFAHKNSDLFDFEGSMMKGIDSFYRKWGGMHTPYSKIYKNNVRNFMTQRAIAVYKKVRYGR